MTYHLELKLIWNNLYAYRKVEIKILIIDVMADILWNSNSKLTVGGVEFL